MDGGRVRQDSHIRQEIGSANMEKNRAGCTEQEQLFQEHKNKRDANKNFQEMFITYQKWVLKETAYHVNERKAILREQFEQWRKETAHVPENGVKVDPLLIFPQEIWKMILEKVTNGNDHVSCCQANDLFNRILMPTKVKQLFGKVFPFILELVEQEDVLNCRLVSKQWCCSVDNYLESANTIVDSRERDTFLNNFSSSNSNTHKLNVFEEYGHRFIFYLPSPRMHVAGDDDTERQWREHPRNPFVGRSITIVATRDVRSELEPREFLTELEELLGYHGHHVWHLRLNSHNSTFMFRNCTSFYSACVQVLTKCSNLRTLILDGRIGIHQQQPKTRSGGKTNLLDLDLLPHLPSLECLHMNAYHLQVLMIQDKLLEKYSSQLKHLSVQFWNGSLYQTFSWGNLRELEIIPCLSADLVKDLLKIKAPNLQKLSLWLYGKDGSRQELDELISLVSNSNFPNVDSLNLNFFEEFIPFTNKKITNLASTLPISPRIKTIEIDCFPVDVRILSFDFLISFPCLNYIIIKLHDNEDSDDDEFIEDHEEIDKANPIENYLHITRYLLEILDSNESHLHRPMYKSNVWDALPCLQVLEVDYSEYFKENHQYLVRRQLFSRQGYLREKMDRRTILSAQLNCAHREADRQNSLRSTWLRKQLINHRMELTTGNISGGAITFATKHSNAEKNLQSCPKPFKLDLDILEKKNTLFEKILPMILMNLEKSDILSCRLVCKNWLAGIDTVMENYHRSTKWTRPLDSMSFIGSFSTPAPFYEFNYNFHAPLRQIFDPSYKHTIRDTMSAHPKNPLIGRSVYLELNPLKQDPEHVREFAALLGEHIWHFTFAIGKGNVNYITLDSGLFCNMLRTIFTNCPNLRTLHLIKSKRDQYEFSNSGQQSYDFSVAIFPHFESLRVDYPDIEFWPILHALLLRCSGQLKCFNTCIMNPYLLLSLQWDLLEELHVNELDTESHLLLRGLTKIRAPNLSRLYITLDQVELGEYPLQVLIAATHNIPTLTELHLKLSQNFKGFTSEEVESMTPGFTAPVLLTNLELIISRKVSLSFDFLLYFPHLRRLRIRDFHEEEVEQDPNGDNQGSDESQDEIDSENDDLKSTKNESGNESESEKRKDEKKLDDEDKQSLSGLERDCDECGSQLEKEKDDHKECNLELQIEIMETDQARNKSVYSDSDFVQLPKQFMENIPKDEDIYRLNVWQVLRSLQLLEYCKGGSDGVICFKAYTRQVYENFRCGEHVQ